MNIKTNQIKTKLQSIQQILSNEYFMIDMREEGNNINIYVQKKGYDNFKYQLGIPKNSINKNQLRKILSFKSKGKKINYSLFINSNLKP